MIQIRPQEKFPIVYRIADPTDSTTYYIRAVLRNSVTGAIIKVGVNNYVNLTHDASDVRRYSVSIQAPNDASGSGFYIDVTTKVYTDSGYTTQSTNYLEKNDTYLIAERWSLSFGSGGGFIPEKAQAAFDYEVIRKIILETFNSLPTTELPSTDLSEVISRSDELKRLIKAVDIPKINLDSHTSTIVSAIQKAVKGINIPTNEAVLNRIEKIKMPEIPPPQDIKPHIENLMSHFSKELDAIREKLPKKEYRDVMNELADRLLGRSEQVDPILRRVKNLT